MDRLEIPRELAGPHVEREYRVGEEVDAFARGPVVVRRRVSRVDIDETQLGIDGRLCPHPATRALAAPPRVLRNLPAFIVRSLWNGVEDPLDRSRPAVDRHDQAARNV